MVASACAFFFSYGMVEDLIRQYATQDSIKASFNCVLSEI